MGIILEELSSISKNKFDVENKLVIKMKPRFGDPFAPNGLVVISVSDAPGQDMTNINCQILYKTKTSAGFYILIGLLCLWSLTWILFASNFYGLIAVLFGWTIIMGTHYIAWTLNKGKLKNYVNYLIGEIKR